MSIGCFGWTVSDGFRCSEQAEVIVGLVAMTTRSKSAQPFIAAANLKRNAN